eukprot:GGOE01018780.1.p1 GENE.GGOE01018780.1~~GGOE01018780.1.p1  ORF type:complete len:185 (+),score=3.34 GGOE01018780.1:41-595(+)
MSIFLSAEWCVCPSMAPAASRQDCAQSKSTPTTPQLSPGGQQGQCAVVTGPAASFALRNSAYAPYFSIMRRQCRESQETPTAQKVKTSPQLQQTDSDIFDSPRGTYTHNPYSFDGPLWVIPSTSTSPPSSQSETDASPGLRQPGASAIREVALNPKPATKRRSRPRPNDRLMITKLAKAWTRSL